MKYFFIVLLSVIFALELTALTYSAPSITQSPYDCVILSPTGWIPCRDVIAFQADA